MSNYIYYSSGEKEDGEYVLPLMDVNHKNKPNVAKTNGEDEPFNLPKEFDLDYYRQKRDKYNKNSPDYWEWDRFLKYSAAVYKFYMAVFNTFYSRFPAQNDLPEFVKTTNSAYDLEQLRINVLTNEKALNKQFYDSRRTISAKLNKHVTLRQLKDRAVEALVRYYILKDNLFLEGNLKFKSSYNVFDFNNPIDVIRCMRGCSVLKRNQTVFITNKRILNLNGHVSELYDAVDVNLIYNNILSGVGALTNKKLDAILQSIGPFIAQLKTNENYADLVTFYENFDNMYLLIYYINKINSNYQNEQMVHYGAFENVGDFKENIYVLACDFLQLTKKLQQTTTYTLFVRDINMLNEKLQNAIDGAREVYLQSI